MSRSCGTNRSAQVVAVERPDEDHRLKILRLLQSFNASKVGFRATVLKPLAVVLKDAESSSIIGGLWGESDYDWLFIDALIVPDELRQQGFGSALMKKAEEIALNRGCVGVRVDTFSFQAVGFYEKLGYRIFGRLMNHPKGYERVYYFKMLSEKIGSQS